MDSLRFDCFFWNLENLFAPETGGPRRDYTPEQGWTTDRFEAKVTRIATLLSEFGPSRGDCPLPPAIMGLCEIETLAIASRLASILPGDYRVAGDGAAIDSEIGYCDTAILYDSSRFNPVYTRYHSLTPRFPKGDVLEARFVSPEGRDLTFFACHWKARTREHTYTEAFRAYAGDYVQQLIWKLHGGENHMQNMPSVIVAGDFNDEPFSRSLRLYLKASWDARFVARQSDPATVFLYNASFEALGRDPAGTNYYTNDFGTPWSMLDQMVFSPSLVDGRGPLAYVPGSFEIVTRGIAGEDGLPRRICGWDEEDNQFWVDDGLSDHFPVKASFEWRPL